MFDIMPDELVLMIALMRPGAFYGLAAACKRFAKILGSHYAKAEALRRFTEQMDITDDLHEKICFAMITHSCRIHGIHITSTRLDHTITSSRVVNSLLMGYQTCWKMQPDGCYKLHSRTYWSRNERHGDHTVYDDSGRPLSVDTYKGGYLHQSCKYDNGTMLMKVEFWLFNGKPRIRWTYGTRYTTIMKYHKNGTLRKQWTILDGIKHGDEHVQDANGILIKEIRWRHGKKM